MGVQLQVELLPHPRMEGAPPGGSHPFTPSDGNKILYYPELRRIQLDGCKEINKVRPDGN